MRCIKSVANPSDFGIVFKFCINKQYKIYVFVQLLQSNIFIPYSDTYRLSPISNIVRKQCKVILLLQKRLLVTIPQTPEILNFVEELRV